MSSWICVACGGENPEGTKFCGHCGSAAAAAAPATTQPAERDVAEALRSFVAGPVAERLVEAGGHIPEERRLVTALFADVSGFTALADRLDPEQLLEVIDPVIAGLSSVVGRHEGYVEKFAGDALMALFGAPISHEDDAVRAVRVALEMHAELARIVGELPHDADLTLHVGINSGHGIARILGSEARTDYAVLGDSVILAQRLESAAPPGETYVSETTVRLTDEEFEFESIGGLTLKGKAEPVPAWRLVGERKTRVEPAVGALVGRQRELTAIVDALGSLEQRRGTVVAVTGEPGIGKSRLTAAVESEATERGARWLHGRCLSYGAGLAYWPYADLLRRWAGIPGTAGAADAGASLAAALDRSDTSAALPFFAQLLGVTPVGAEAPSELEPEAFRRALHRAFADWLRALAAERPVVVVLEDVHWIDASSLDLTRELAGITAGAAVAIYLAARSEAREWLDDLTRDGLAIPLEPLDEVGIEALIEAALGSAPPPGLAPFIARRTAGNPLFVQELLRSLLDSGAIEREDGRWAMRSGWDARTLPATIEEVLSARIDTLARPAASLLQTAAVIGRRVPLLLLQAVAHDVSQIELLVGDLVTRGFLEQHDDALAFHHALIQDAAYERLLRRKRQELHRRVADAAEALYGAGEDTVDLLARHLYLGGGGAKAVEYLRRAGERSKQLFANEEGILHFTRAAELAPDDPELRLALADLHELVGNYDDSLQLYESVRSQDAGNVRSWAGLASTLRNRGEYERALALVDEAFRQIALRDADLSPLWLEQGWTLSVAGLYDQAVDVFLAGLELLVPPRDVLRPKFLLNLSRAEMLGGDLDAALAHGLEAQHVAEERDDLQGLAAALRVLGDTYRLLGRLPDAAATIRRGLELAERIGSAEEIGGCLINLGLVELSLGNLDAALSCNARAIEAFEAIHHGSGRATAYSNQGWALANVGRYDEALDACAKALDVARSIGNKVTIAQTLDTIAFVALRQGDFVEATAQAEDAARLFLEMKMLSEAQEALGRAAEAWENTGENERALAVRTRAGSLSLAEV
jgi:class 3 adenylate cyclase/tetratricopeptide (TPR) repeat protein